MQREKAGLREAFWLRAVAKSEQTRKTFKKEPDSYS